MPKHSCGAKLELDGRTLACALPVDHGPPVHQDESGEAWGDVDLHAEPVPPGMPDVA